MAEEERAAPTTAYAAVRRAVDEWRVSVDLSDDDGPTMPDAIIDALRDFARTHPQEAAQAQNMVRAEWVLVEGADGDEQLRRLHANERPLFVFAAPQEKTDDE